MHWIDWAKSRLKIVSKRGGREGGKLSFVPNRAQMRLYGLMEAQRLRGYPIRIIVLKSRRQGITTAVQAYFFANAQNIPHTNCFVCAHDTESSQDIFGMNTMFERELPDEERKMKRRSSRREIVWEQPHWSKYQVQTAGNANIKRGATIHYLHCSEFAFYRNVEKVTASLFTTVPSSANTAIVIESTANGVGNDFYERWNNAVKQYKDTGGSLDGFVPIFFGWLEDADNILPIPKKYEWGVIAEEERKLLELGAKPEQLYWRRWKIASDYNGDTEKFKQEYPATPKEAFLHSGRPAIPRVITEHHTTTVEEPRRCRLVWDEYAPRRVRAEYGNYERNYWMVWRDPQENHGYTCGGDVATGELSVRSDPRSDADANVAIIFDRRDLEFVAAYKSDEPPDMLGEEMLKAALWYNGAWTSPEINGQGMAALAALRRADYPNIYQRESGVDDLEFQVMPKLGWMTTGGNRDMMIDDYTAACRPEWRVRGAEKEPNFEGKIVVHWAELVEQEETFEINAKGIRRHRDGKHDDALFAAFIALQLHIRCPRSTGDSMDIHSRPQTMAELNAPGARDIQRFSVVTSGLETS